MNHPLEPTRLLLDDNADPVVRRLLQSVRHEGPSQKNVLAAPAAIAALIATQSVKTAAAATATITTAAASTTAAAPLSAAALGTLPILVKSIGIGLVLGGAVVATAIKATDPPHHAPAVTTAIAESSSGQHSRASTQDTTSVPSSAQLPIVTADEEAAPPNEPPAVATAKARASVRPAFASLTSDHPELSREVELIDAARRALQAGDPGHAIEQLDRHAALGRRLLEPEATVLRVRALLAQHRAAEAAGVANEFIARQPHCPQAQVLGQLISADPK